METSNTYRPGSEKRRRLEVSTEVTSKKTLCCSQPCLIFGMVVGALLVAIGVVMFITFDDILRDQVKERKTGKV
jgi:hypothetical protein